MPFSKRIKWFRSIYIDSRTVEGNLRLCRLSIRLENELARPSTNNNRKVVAVIAEAAFHESYSSMPIKSAEIRTITPNNVSILTKQEQLQPAIILLDCGPKFERGLQMLGELKKAYPQTPVIFLARGKSYDTVLKAYRAGARDFVEKPANLFELRNTVEAMLKIMTDGKEARAPLTVVRAADDEHLQSVTLDKPTPILRAIRYVEDNLSQKITLDVLAAEARLSKYHFSRLFFRHMKMTPAQFITKMRVEMARELLMFSDLSMSDICWRVGFSNFSSFDKKFKKSTGTTPSSYRKSFRKSEINDSA